MLFSFPQRLPYRSDSWRRATAETENTQGPLAMSRAAVLAVRIERKCLRQGEGWAGLPEAD
jgi:hypothetical protein